MWQKYLVFSVYKCKQVPEKKEEIADKKEVKAAKPVKGAKAAPKQQPLAEVAKEEGSRERHNSGDASKEQRKGNSSINLLYICIFYIGTYKNQ